MKFLDWYKNKIESNNLAPDEKVWENIQNHLDIENSWQIIDKKLNTNLRIKRMKQISYAALFLFLFSLASYILLKQQSPNKFKKIYTEKTTEPQKKGIKKQPIFQTEKKVSPLKRTNYKQNKIKIKKEHQEYVLSNKTEENIKPTTKAQQVNKKSIYQKITKTQQANKKNTNLKIANAQQANKKNTFHKTINAQQIKEKKIYQKTIIAQQINEKNAHPKIAKIELANLDFKKISLGNFPSKEIIWNTPNFPQLENFKNPNKTHFTKLFVGNTSQIANTWLINDKTINGLKSTNLTSTNISYGSNFGFYLRTNMTQKIDLQLDVNLFSQTKQNYNEYQNGQYVEDALTFNYSQIGLSTKFYLFSDKLIKGEHGLNIGIYGAYLRNAQITANTETSDLADYKPIDYGIFGGYEYIFQISQNFGFGTGIRTYLGLNNIYAGNEIIPANFNSTNNASINITFSLNYRIK